MGSSHSRSPAAEAAARLPELREQAAHGKRYRIWLFGDSILDNSYWNGVGAATTGEVLKTLVPANVEVKDRSAEELDAMTYLHCLQTRTRYRVRGHYVAHRADAGVPYDPPDGAIDVCPAFDPELDFVVICVGGNDFALRGEMDPTVILGFVREVVQFYKARGVRPERMMFMTPYPPTLLMKAAVRLMCKSLGALYAQMLGEARAMCDEEGIGYIPLDHFTDRERKGPGTGIPEPTPAGARALAELIAVAALTQAGAEQAAGGAEGAAGGGRGPAPEGKAAAADDRRDEKE